MKEALHQISTQAHSTISRRSCVHEKRPVVHERRITGLFSDVSDVLVLVEGKLDEVTH